MSNCQYCDEETKTARHKNCEACGKLLNETNADRKHPYSYGTLIDALVSGKKSGMAGQQLRDFGSAAVTAKITEVKNQKAAEVARKNEEDAINAKIKSAGYTWKKVYEEQDYALDDMRKSDWQLYAPDGRRVSKLQAMRELGIEIK